MVKTNYNKLVNIVHFVENISNVFSIVGRLIKKINVDFMLVKSNILLNIVVAMHYLSIKLKFSIDHLFYNFLLVKQIFISNIWKIE